MEDSYRNFFHIAEHKPSAYLLEFDSLFLSDHRSEDDKQNRNMIGYPRLHATSPKICVPLSDTIFFGTQCRQTILDIYNSTSCSLE
jgi:hypothetical protein